MGNKLNLTFYSYLTSLCFQINSPQDYNINSYNWHYLVTAASLTGSSMLLIWTGKRGHWERIEHLDNKLSYARYLDVDLCPYHFILRTVSVFKIPAKYSVLAISARVSQSEVWLSSLNERSSWSRVTERHYTVINFALIGQHNATSDWC